MATRIAAAPAIAGAPASPVPVPYEELAAALRADPDGERLCWAVRPATLVLGDGKDDLGPGAILVGAQRLYWWSDARAAGFAFAYRAIMIHAVARDASTFPRPCVYLQLDAPTSGDDDADGGASHANGAGDVLMDVSEVRLVPEDAALGAVGSRAVCALEADVTGAVDTLYDAVSIGQMLHPDPDEDGDDDDDDDDNDEDGMGVSAHRRGILDHLDSILDTSALDAAAAAAEPASKRARGSGGGQMDDAPADEGDMAS